MEGTVVVPMSVSTTQYIRKPLYVDAVRVTGENFDDIAAWCQGKVKEDDDPEKGTGKKYIHVRVHNPINPRQTRAYFGDWILYTEKGYKIYTNPAFRAAFDEVTPEEEKALKGEVILGTDEVLPGMTLNDLVRQLREGRLGFVPVIKEEQDIEKAA
jgi:hypothetical protein